jgi:hypothetical protein
MHRFRRLVRPTALGALAIAVALVAGTAVSQVGAPAPVQSPPPHAVQNDTLHLTTNVGSFKILGAAEEPAEGRVELSFSGTLLVSGLDGTVTPGPGLRREYHNPERNKQVYFGTGTIVVEGKFFGIQWFGRDLSGKFQGTRGVIRLYGEFDENLDTGYYWYSDPERKEYWGIHGMTVTVPQREMDRPVVPVPRSRSGG